PVSASWRSSRTATSSASSPSTTATSPARPPPPAWPGATSSASRPASAANRSTFRFARSLREIGSGGREAVDRPAPLLGLGIAEQLARHAREAADVAARDHRRRPIAPGAAQEAAVIGAPEPPHGVMVGG